VQSGPDEGQTIVYLRDCMKVAEVARAVLKEYSLWYGAQEKQLGYCCDEAHANRQGPPREFARRRGPKNAQGDSRSGCQAFPLRESRKSFTEKRASWSFIPYFRKICIVPVRHCC